MSWSWTRPADASWFQMTDGRYTGSDTSTASVNQPYGTTQCANVRAAFSQRLAGWGWYGPWSNQSCQSIPVPAPSQCYASTVGPDSLTVAVSGGTGVQVRMSGGTWGAAPRTFSGLTPYTVYSFEARSLANGNASGSVLCGARTITNPYPTAWGVAGSCPGVGIYIGTGAPLTYQVRQTGSSTCQARALVTVWGEASGAGEAGSVVATYGLTMPATVFSRISGSGGPNTLPAVY